MAYTTTGNLRSGMVVARNLLDQNQRVLLRAGVALSETHIQALRSLGVKGLEIRSNHYQNGPVPRSVSSGCPDRTTEGSEVSISHKEAATPKTNKPALETLRVTRAATKPLRPKLEPLIAKQTEAILNELLKGTRIKEDSAVAAVVRLCAIRVLHMKKRQKTDVIAT